MRDRHRPKAFFDEHLAIAVEFHHGIDYLALYQEALTELEDGDLPDDSPLTYGHTSVYARDVAFMYARGDALETVKAERIDRVVERYLQAALELQSLNRRFPAAHVFFFDELSDPHNLHSVYALLCWLICFGADADKLGQIAPLLAPAGIDRLLDTVLSRYQPDRDVAAGCGAPKTFDLLQEAVDARPEARSELLEQYLQSFGARMSTLNGLDSLGIAPPAKKVKTNAALIASIGDMHQGLWAWEVALVAKVFAVDDERFKDHEFYPYDLVHFTD